MQAQFVDTLEPSHKLNLNIDINLNAKFMGKGSVDPDYAVFTSKMKMLAHVCETDNAFVYIANNHSSLQSTAKNHLLYGNQEYANKQNFNELATLVGIQKKPLQSLIDCNNLFAKQQSLALLVLVSYNEQAQVIGFLGTYIPVQSPHVDLNKNSVTGLLNLIRESFEDELSLNQLISFLQQKQSSYSQMAELNQDLICVKDENHRIVYANKALLATFEGTKIKNIIGRTSTQLYEPEASAQIIESDLTALEQGSCKSNQLIRLANHDERILNTTKKSFVGIDGKTYLMSISRDVTEKEILINDLKRSNEDLDNFAYVASHDMRSPLNVIKRLVTWVKEDCADLLPPDSNENLDLVLNRTERMEKLLVDLLSYSRIGKDYQQATTVNLRALVLELLSLIDLPMGFVVNCDDIDIKVATVPFNVVMLNLLSNAIKHHDSGNAKIEIKAKNTPRGSVITVLDNGPGIEEKDRKRIFQLFETLRPRDEVEGSGMGLSVVKKIVEHYGGTIKVENNQPRGTKFVIDWPLNNFARAVLDNLNG
jgi:PAS domain S-box-containing protein